MRHSEVAATVLAAIATAVVAKPGTDTDAQAKQDAKDIKDRLSLDKETADKCESILLTVASSPARELVSNVPEEDEEGPVSNGKKGSAKKPPAKKK